VQRFADAMETCAPLDPSRQVGADASLAAIPVASIQQWLTDVHLAAGTDFNGGELFTKATMAERCWAC
jgi:hypothetical protein